MTLKEFFYSAIYGVGSLKRYYLQTIAEDVEFEEIEVEPKMIEI